MMAREEKLHKILIDKKGRFLLAGRSDHRIIIVRLLEDGSKDLSFGTQGKMNIPLEINTFNPPEVLKIQEATDGSIFVMTRGISSFGGVRTDLWKILPDGGFDRPIWR